MRAAKFNRRDTSPAPPFWIAVNKSKRRFHVSLVMN